ncbi:P-loop containing nucleoside triphosphate hydrolase protein [Ephemerocybe angulata]|uniref:DNA 3'-5' helicase n=1 Tax=Ephemerocybe angulata TaxID=980116 RepID=A0A8H6HGM3_9AGAR|nr:P-loop containing nucleoside triphosphate hydrolase protein [Tulosesus angulatus]
MAQPTPPSLPAIPPVRKYKPSEVNLSTLSERALAKLKKKPFEWQLKAAKHLLCGEDLILDVGTGCGKSLVFQLPLLLDDMDISMVVSPLSALMVEQLSLISTVAVCAETLEEMGRDTMFERIVSGYYQQVLVSPEIVISPAFRKAVFSKQGFTDRLRCVCVDEAHCINIWGGTFRPDYAQLGVLRGRLPSAIPLLIASATLPTHVLEDVRRKLQLFQDAPIISVTNDRPNVSLSSPSDIAQTALYVNQRTTCEDACDVLRKWARHVGFSREAASAAIVFYHAKVGTARKREIEAKVKSGEVRIIVCTEALGMGCDIRSLKRVVMWQMPLLFCGLVQRAGHAARDMTQKGEAILIVSGATIAKGVSETQMSVALEEGVLEHESENCAEDEEESLRNEGIAVGPGNELESVEELGVRVGRTQAATKSKGKGKRADERYNQHELSALNKYLPVHLVQLQYPATSTFRPDPSLLCCDVCDPDSFKVEDITLEKVKGLARGRKKQLPYAEELGKRIRTKLEAWHEDTLLQEYYGDSDMVSISGEALLGDDVISKIADCGKYLRTAEDLARHLLLNVLEPIYTKLDEDIGLVTLPESDEDVLEPESEESDNAEPSTTAAVPAPRIYTRNEKTEQLSGTTIPTTCGCSAGHCPKAWNQTRPSRCGSTRTGD